MRTVIATVLAISVLLAAAIPVAAFGTENFANHGIAWQKSSVRIVNNTNNAKVMIDRLIANVDPYLDFLKRIEDSATSCQTNAGFTDHHIQVLGYAISLGESWLAMDNGHYRASNRHAQVAIRHYRKADTFGAHVINRCW